MKKKMSVLGLSAAIISLMTVVPAFAGWEANGTGYKYRYDSGEYARDQIITLDGVVYGFDESGNMAQGWLQQRNGNWFLFAENGAQLTGWQQVNGVWYYMDPSKQGRMLTGAITVDGKKYIMNDSGAMKTGSIEYGGYTYYAEPDGSLRRNTQQTNGSITIRYDDSGKEWYRNEENIINSKGGGEQWLPLLAGSALWDQRSFVQEDNVDIIKDKKEELAEQYKEATAGVSYKKLPDKKQKWEARARKRLAELYVDEGDISNFILKVESGTYRPDEEETSEEYGW